VGIDIFVMVAFQIGGLVVAAGLSLKWAVEVTVLLGLRSVKRMRTSNLSVLFLDAVSFGVQRRKDVFIVAFILVRE